MGRLTLRWSSLPKSSRPCGELLCSDQEMACKHTNIHPAWVNFMHLCGEKFSESTADRGRFSAFVKVPYWRTA